MNIVKTAKGTELPLRDLKGKKYLEAAYRVLWAREEHADWGFETEFLQLGPDLAIAKATIKDGSGRVLAQATKTETPAGFADFVEKAETGAIGRALALCGYGTQFALELDEGERIVDGPREAKSAPRAAINGDPGSYVVKMGKKFIGKRLDQCDAYELADFSKWLSMQDLNGIGLETRNAIEAYLATREKKVP